jgi:hypothetical protein
VWVPKPRNSSLPPATSMSSPSMMSSRSPPKTVVLPSALKQTFGSKGVGRDASLIEAFGGRPYHFRHLRDGIGRKEGEKAGMYCASGYVTVIETRRSTVSCRKKSLIGSTMIPWSPSGSALSSTKASENVFVTCHFHHARLARLSHQDPF